jgi:hypothetical protein
MMRINPMRLFSRRIFDGFIFKGGSMPFFRNHQKYCLFLMGLAVK